MPGEIPTRTSTAFSVKYTTFNGSPSGKIVKKSAERVVKPTDVVVKITHSGYAFNLFSTWTFTEGEICRLCATDVYQRKSDICLGHEGVGVVEFVGSAVTTVKVGDRVGIPVVRATCGKCEACLVGEDVHARPSLTTQAMS